MASEDRTPETMTIQSFQYEQVTALSGVDREDWLLVNYGVIGEFKPHYLTPIAPDGSEILCRRHGRNIGHPLVKLDQGTVDAGRVWRAVERPSSGIPGTWCDGLDDNEEHCGFSLMHKKKCRH